MKDFFDEIDSELSELHVSAPKKKSSDTPKKEDSEDRVAAPKKQQTQKSPKPEAKKTSSQGKKGQAKGGNNSNFRRHRRPSAGGGGARLSVKFPETKFYLPTLRDKYTRVIPVGGNDETGAKNMNMFQYKDDILLVDCGIQFAETKMYGADSSVPDVSFLAKYTKNIKGIVITHAHLDHIGALKHVLPAIGMPPVYGTKLTLGIIRKGLEEARILDKAVLIEVDAGSDKKHKIGHFEVEFFRVNHSVPDCAGLYIESPGGAKFVHTGDFKIDHTPAIDKPADLKRMAEIGKRGITMLMSDSTGSTRKGFSKSEAEVAKTLEKIISQHTSGRLIIATFSSWISRVQQLIDICEKYDKVIFLSGRSMVENIRIAKELGYLRMKPKTMKKMTPKNTEGIAPSKQVIITTGSQGEEFAALSRMAVGQHNCVDIVKGDTVVFSSSVVPGNDRSVVAVISKLIRLGANVITKDNALVHVGGHALQEEQKIMAKLMKPRYFMPVFGDLYFRKVHGDTAIETGVKPENVLLLDNGNIIDFAPSGSVFKSRIKVPIQDIIIDGYGLGTTTSHVLAAREMMMNAGVLVVLFKVDKKTGAILGNLKLETRGFVYLEEVRLIHRMVIKKAKDVYENTLADVPDMEEKDIVKILKKDLENFIYHKTEREPMVIPMILKV